VAGAAWGRARRAGQRSGAARAGGAAWCGAGEGLGGRGGDKALVGRLGLFRVGSLPIAGQGGSRQRQLFADC